MTEAASPATGPAPGLRWVGGWTGPRTADGTADGTIEDPVAAAFERRVEPGLAVAGDAERVARACHDMAIRFHRGGKAVVFGNGGPATDAQHLAVEFVHPAVVGKRALPAISLANDAPTLTGLAQADGYDAVFAAQLRLLGGPDDIAVGISADGRSRNVLSALEAAHELGMLTIALVGGDGGEIAASRAVDHALAARTGDPRIVKEVHVTVYHILWELVHVFLEQPGVLTAVAVPVSPHPHPTRVPGDGTPPPVAATCDRDAEVAGCVTCADEAVPVRVVELRGAGLALVDTGSGREEVSVALVEAQVGDVVLVHAKEAIAVQAPPQGAGVETLYPFLYSGAADLDAVLAEVTRSTAEKAREVVALRQAVVERDGARLAACAQALARAFRGGGRLYAFGNGGSSTDAHAVAQLFLNPGGAAPGLPAIALTSDVALLTALANDVGFEVVFARQLAAVGAEGDIAVGLSTSGGSANVLRGFEQAKQRGMVTVGLAGYDGGRMAEAGTIDHLFVVPSTSVHRIQEAQTTVYHVLWELTLRALARGA